MTIRGKGAQRGVSQKEKIYFYYSKSKRQVGFLLSVIFCYLFRF